MPLPAHLFAAVLLLATLTAARYQTVPRRLFANPGGSVTILGKYGSPLERCEFWYYPGKRRVDLSDGADSPSDDEYEYFGSGLANGECGITLKNVQEENDGIVESRVKSISKATWDEAGTTLRVTPLPKSDLPVFEMRPNVADLHLGDNLNITCNTDRAITMCHWYLPGGTFVNFDKGVKSASSRLVRYLGAGLEHGDCGIQLTGATDKHNGYLVCKVGMWPDTTPGPWETEAMYITTKAPPPRRPDPVPGDHVTVTTRPGGGGKCPALLEPNLEILCTHGGSDVPCDQPMTVNTVAQMRCKRDIHLADPGREQKTVTCTESGTWSGQPAKCTLDCGNRNNAGRPFVSGGNVSKEGEFPWQVAIYNRQSKRIYNLICSGSLVSPKYVVTAAHCFGDRTPGQHVDVRRYFIVAGKFRTNWYEGEEKAQRRNISSLVVQRHFTGRLQNFALDIAVIKVNKPYELSWSINVVCVDWRSVTNANFRDGTMGIVPGWGLTETSEQSSELHSVEIPYISYDTCWSQVSLDFQRFLTNDKMCGGYVGRGVSVCPGDSGGGFVFPVQTTRGNRYFLKGIVSVGPKKSSDKCEINQVAAFTVIQSHITWLWKIVANDVSVES